ncbi:MAG: type I glyceraldehyde-3-phosphate dehydrogenase [Candidatus Pacebacteria bacterium]|nr:type I glyceraldehyde-3-phosphate dehydrogenase [Candidatus Paceibacterota bacterium]
MPIKVAINGFGRIGRAVSKILTDNHPEVQITAINDLTECNALVHLIKFDSVYGKYSKPVSARDGIIKIGDSEIKTFAESDPAKLPWKDLGVDIVLECTGKFTKYEDMMKHIQAGAKRVIASAPSKTPDQVPSFLLGINADQFDPEKDQVMDMGSCTTNCLAPVAKVLDREYKIVKGFMTTTHAYTNDQKILDVSHKDLRRARAAAINIIPTTTGAAKTIGKVIPELKGKLDGIALRVPVPTVSVVDLVCEVEKSTTAEEVNYAFKKASQEEALQGIFGVEDAPLVSSDYVGSSFSSVVDSPMTMANDNLVKVIAWYDNEWGYACRLAEFVEYVGRKK